MFAHQRHQAILQKINQEEAIKVSDLLEMFDVSFETVRRDLEFLEKEGLLKRVHGGAVLPEKPEEVPFTVRDAKFVSEKNELAETATRFVSEGQTVALDVSTTNTQFAKTLKSKFRKLTVLTNSLPIANELVDVSGFTIILAGGVIRNEERSIIGDLAEAFVSRFHVDLFFMSMSGVTLADGITDFGIGEVQIKKLMQRNAKRTVVLADSSKFDAVSLLKVCGVHEVERFVTDSKIDRRIVDRYMQHGVEIVFE